MSKPRLPFENRWTSQDKALGWFEELERQGVETVQVVFADHQALLDRGDGFDEVPAGFVRDWLGYHRRLDQRRERVWRLTVLVLCAIAALASSVTAFEVGLGRL